MADLARTESKLEASSRAGTHSTVCAVIVTYNPEPSLEQNVRALLSQVGRLIIVDNQSTAAAHSLIARVAAACGVEVIWNQQNLGIAAGLNAGVEAALSSGQCSWIAMFDQDSLVPPDYAATIFEAYSACPYRNEVAIVGANYNQIQDCGDNPIPTRKGFVFREIKSAITSGSFVKSAVFGISGGYDESLFMDYVDHEFCLRLRKHGFRIIQAGNALLEHRLGSPTLHRFLWKRFLSTNHSPNRRYHNARNRLVVYRRYLSSEMLWVLNDAFGWLREIVKVAMVEPNRAEKLVSTARGAWDAMKEPSGAQLER